MTVIEGLAGGTIPALPSGVRPTDGHNLWPALLGQNLTSPRTEVIHAVHNQYADDPSLHQQPLDQHVELLEHLCAWTCRYFNKSLGNWPYAAARFGDWKVIVGKDCEEQQTWQAWPTPGETEIPFGLTGGWLEPGQRHSRVAPARHTILTHENLHMCRDQSCTITTA